MKYPGLVAQRIRRLTTDQEIAGSNPAEIETSILFFQSSPFLLYTVSAVRNF